MIVTPIADMSLQLLRCDPSEIRVDWLDCDPNARFFQSQITTFKDTMMNTEQLTKETGTPTRLMFWGPAHLRDDATPNEFEFEARPDDN